MVWAGTGREVDVTDPDALEAYSVGKSIDWVVNCAAYTDVERAETEGDVCQATNAEGAFHLARWAQAHGASLVHFSSDYVFSGQSGKPYREDDAVGPLNVYGMTKVEAEEMIRAHCQRHYIVRTSWLYGASQRNFVATMVSRMREEPELRVIDDQIGCPTWSRDLARVVVELMRRGTGLWGTYHLAGEGHCSRFQYAQAIFDEAQKAGILDHRLSVNIIPVTSDQYPTKAQRPEYSVLSKEKLKATFGLSLPPWRASLKAFLSQEYRLHNPKAILVTGGAGFIGSHFIRYLFTVAGFGGTVVNYDKLTYASQVPSLDDIEATQGDRYVFLQGDIADSSAVELALRTHQVDAIVHFAAESHVDRSISGPDEFLRTNILGTYTLLQAAKKVWGERTDVRFHHVSTDEVYGSLGDSGSFLETDAYDPRSPYSASKASSDHLVKAWYHTYGLPVTVSHCSNNYGPHQHREKLIPHMIHKLLEGKLLPVYGDGKNVRDWIYVEDHVSAVWAIVTRGRLGESYNIGGENEWTNLDLVRLLCQRVAHIQGKAAEPYLSLITHVKDRPGHDRRYALDCTKIKTQLHWTPRVTFEQGLDTTIRWYLDHHEWVVKDNRDR